MNVPANVLFEGAWYALEQCGRRLRAALILHDNKEYPVAAGEALLAHEDLGLHRFLLDLWRKAVQGGVLPTDEQIRAFRLDHEKKQQRGHIGVHLSAPPGGRLSHLIKQILQNPPSSPEDIAARAEMQRLTKRIDKEKPSRRHKTRKRSMYVDLNKEGTGWLRPSDITGPDATQILREAVSAYMGTLGNLGVGLDPSSADKELAAALAAWPNHPELPVLQSPQVV